MLTHNFHIVKLMLTNGEIKSDLKDKPVHLIHKMIQVKRFGNVSIRMALFSNFTQQVACRIQYNGYVLCAGIVFNFCTHFVTQTIGKQIIYDDQIGINYGYFFGVYQPVNFYYGIPGALQHYFYHVDSINIVFNKKYFFQNSNS
jgi:hypothetical protein